MRYSRSLLLPVLLAISCSILSAQDAKGRISGDPSVNRTAEGFEIAFSLTASADVTVRIVDADGKVARHLACGMVGSERAAKPFAPKSLAQKIAWDGKDDAGKPVDPKGCKATIGVGMAAKFDRFLLYEPNAAVKSDGFSVMAMPKGEYLVTQPSGVHIDTMRVFDANGKFLRQAWPLSLNKPKDVMEPFLASRWGADDWNDRRVPFSVNHNSRYTFGVRSGSEIVTTDGYIIGEYAGVGSPSLWSLDPNGLPDAWAWRDIPWFKQQQRYKTNWRLAAGLDGDFYLTDNYHHVVMHYRAKGIQPIASFTHNGKARLEGPRFYLGEPGVPGDDEGHFKGPDGVAVDADGSLMVVDGDVVKTYSPDGRFVKSGDKTLLPKREAIPEAVQNLAKAPRALSFPHHLRVAPDGTLYVEHYARNVRYVVSDVEGKTFVPRGVPATQGYSTVDSEGNWYVGVSTRRNEADKLWKYARDGQRAKFGEKNEILIEPDHHEIKGVFVRPDGDIYLVTALSKWKMKDDQSKRFGDFTASGNDFYNTRVDVYGPDGSLKRKGLVRSLGINDVAVDRDGNIYVIESTMWHGAQMSGTANGGVTGRNRWWPMPWLTEAQANLDPKTESNKRFSLLARLVKFGPDGGALDGVDGAPQLWNCAGVSGVSPWNCGGECPAGQMFLDPDQRLWVPDTFMYCVKAVDTAGNEMVRAGTYGNEDCKGGGGDRRIEGTRIVVDPEIPLARPSGMAVHDDCLIIADMLAHRLARCRLTYAEQKTIIMPD